VSWAAVLAIGVEHLMMLLQINFFFTIQDKVPRTRRGVSP
jgi:hypothetical protein